MKNVENMKLVNNKNIKMEEQKKLGIIGAGYVGSAIKHHFQYAKIWDKFVDTPNTFDEVLEQDYIFLCLPTPYSKRGFKGCDISAIEENLEKINKLKSYKVVILKSTIPPSTSNYLQTKYKHTIIVFNPEFLTAKYAKEDFAYPDKQVLGYTNEDSKIICEAHLDFLPKAQRLIVTAVEAEIIKYMLNTYYSMKVVFSNQIYDVCQLVGADYEKVKLGFVLDKRVNDSHFDIWHEDFRGFAGACLPKDLKTFIESAKQFGVDLKLHKVIDKINSEYTKF